MTTIVVATVAMGCVASGTPTMLPAPPAADATVDTPAEPTATIGLTLVPTPTRMPSALLGTRSSAVELAYMENIDQIADRFASLSRHFPDLNQRAGKDTSLIEDDDWKGETNAVLELMTEQAHRFSFIR